MRACPACGRVDRTRWVSGLHASDPDDARFAPPHVPRHYSAIVPAVLLGAWVTVLSLAWMVSHLRDQLAWAFVAGLAALLLLITARLGLAWWRDARQLQSADVRSVERWRQARYCLGCDVVFADGLAATPAGRVGWWEWAGQGRPPAEG